MKNNKQYCIFCGEENKVESKKCTNCKKTLNPKSDLYEYLKNNIKEEFQNKVTDKFTSVIINYIKSHLYGAILSLSILLTATSGVIVATNNNKISVVSEKPIVINTYAGLGLNSEEVVKKYVESLINNNLQVAKNLQLDTFYSDLRNEITPIHRSDVVYEMSTKRDIYFKDIKGYNIYNASYNEDNLLINNKYPYTVYNISTYYCSYNTCKEDNYDFTMITIVEVVEIENNYYINTEAFSAMGISQAYPYFVLQKNNGDTSQMNFEEIDEYFYNCLENPDSNCDLTDFINQN